MEEARDTSCGERSNRMQDLSHESKCFILLHLLLWSPVIIKIHVYLALLAIRISFMYLYSLSAQTPNWTELWYYVIEHEYEY